MLLEWKELSVGVNQVVLDRWVGTMAGSVMVRVIQGAENAYGDNLIQVIEMWEESHTGNIRPTTHLEVRLNDGGCWLGNNVSIPTPNETVALAIQQLTNTMNKIVQEQMQIMLSQDLHPLQHMSWVNFDNNTEQIQTLERILGTLSK